MNEKIVMRNDPEAATKVTLTGWKSRRGVFYGDNEDAARYDGCTHVPCGKCGAPTEKMWTACRPCRDLADEARYTALPRVAWDGESMVYSQTLDRYFATLNDAYDELADDQTLEDLQLVVCTPNRGRWLEEDYFSDDMAEDGELPSCILEAIDAFNAVLQKAPVLSWSPGKFAISIPERFHTEGSTIENATSTL